MALKSKVNAADNILRLTSLTGDDKLIFTHSEIVGESSKTQIQVDNLAGEGLNPDKLLNKSNMPLI